MKILLVHNFYQQPGGEEQVFFSESDLLKKNRHTVIHFTVHNDDVSNINKISLATKTIWNHSTYVKLKEVIRKERPQIVHFHNTFPLISPSAYYAARSEGVPVIQTLHNYRILCPNSLFLKKGNICVECLDKKIPWSGVLNACYRNSRTASAAVAGMLTIHRLLKTWIKNVDLYIALTNFAKDIFIRAGIPSSKIIVKPNFVDLDSGVGEGKGNYALFVGRLSHEKGINILLNSWEKLNFRIPLKIIGDGPLSEIVIQAKNNGLNIEWLGWRSPDDVYKIMKDAKFLIFPSLSFETFGRVIIEAFAMGTPVITSNVGAAAELVNHGKTGLHFNPYDPDDLVKKIDWMMRNEKKLNIMRNECRRDYEMKYNPQRNYKMLIDIYNFVINKTTI